MKTIPVITDLPTAHFREIGRIIVLWANIEAGLRHFAYDLLDLDRKRGRVAVRDPRASDYPAFYAEILQAMGIEPPKNLTKFGKKIQAVENMRNMVAHGLWAKGPTFSTPILQIVSGSWQPTANTTIKRRLKPEGVRTPVKSLRGVTRACHILMDQLTQLFEDIAVHAAAQATSQNKSA